MDRKQNKPRNNLKQQAWALSIKAFPALTAICGQCSNRPSPQDFPSVRVIRLIVLKIYKSLEKNIPKSNAKIKS
jgi:hypothetical protein